MTRIHYLRRIAGTADAWVHCGRRMGTVQATRRLRDVTCRICRGYIAKGLAYGYAAHKEDA